MKLERARNIRKAILAHLELVASADEQLAYEERVPFERVSNELFNQWDDAIGSRESLTAEYLEDPIFTEQERVACIFFDRRLTEVSKQLGRGNLPHIREFSKTPEWAQIAAAAQECLRVFQLREHESKGDR